MSKSKVVFSGIQPTGVFTLGNLIGALKNWKNIQKEHNCIYSIVDMHALTVKLNPEQLKKNVLSSFALLLACGIDPYENIVFIQSHVPEHAQLNWVLSCFTPFGSLNRMTQFKDKSLKDVNNINSGLFTYPVLMASDILLYDTDLVPVGADQKQHLELARDIAVRFNSVYGDIFKVPESYISDLGSRIMSLQNPDNKMSKSDSNKNSYILLTDERDDIIKKFKRCVTDSDNKIVFDENKKGISNLLSIYSCINEISIKNAEKQFDGKGYGDFKIAVGESVSDYIEPIRENYYKILSNESELERIYKLNAERARKIAVKNLKKIYDCIGFL